MTPEAMERIAWSVVRMAQGGRRFNREIVRSMLSDLESDQDRESVLRLAIGLKNQKQP